MAASLFQWIRPWWRTALDLAFPPRCAACGAWAAGAAVCRPCVAAFPVAPQACQRCGLPIVDGDRMGRALGECVGCGALGAVRRLRAAGLYTGSLRSVLLALKFDGRSAIARPVGAWLADVIASDAELAAAEVLIPVPLHAARLRERGYNQASEIAAAIAERLRKPMVDGLARTRATAPQSSLNAAGRTHNLNGAFALRAPLRARSVLLIDDVVTTGATLAACAAALSEAGTRDVFAAAVARTPRRR